MSTGNRRWQRKGKEVAVPNPLNLPSQRWQRKDEEVAVPKPLNLPSQRGSLSWVRCHASDPYGASLVSPNSDGTISTRHIGGRPSSSGGTAGSDRTHEVGGSGRGPNSRPSSSGSLTSNHASIASSRPLSADTRVCSSSQLSPFAEPASPTGAVDKLVLNSKNHDSEDNNSHGRPGSAPGRVEHPKEKAQPQTGMPMRPGFYPGPVPYDGDHGPPMGYNPNEPEIPFLEMPDRYPIYNRYPPQKFSKPTALQRREQPRKGSIENEWEADNRTDERFYRAIGAHRNNQSRISLGHQGHSSDSTQMEKSSEIDKRREESKKKEEERTRMQKAKALAKLETLDRRTLAGDSSAQKLDMPVNIGAAQKDSEESKKHYIQTIDDDEDVTEQSEKPLTSFATQPDPKESQKHPDPLMDADKHEPQKLANVLHFEAPSDTNQEPVIAHAQSVHSKLDAVNTGVDDGKTACNDVSLRRNKLNKQKQSINVESIANDKQKQSTQVESRVTDKPTRISTSEAQKDHDVGATEIVTSQVDLMHVPSLPNNSNIIQESVGHNRRINNRSGRNKHRQDEAAFSTLSQSPVPPKTHLAKAPASVVPNESHPLKTSASSTSQSPVTKESFPSPGPKEIHPAKTFAAASASQLPILKQQNSRLMQRNVQVLRSGDKFDNSKYFVWVPVQSHNKLEPEAEGSQKATYDAPITVRNSNPVQSSVNSKRAEVEHYVPKTVAKELAQHGSIQQPVPLASSTQTSDKNSEREGSGSQFAKP